MLRTLLWMNYKTKWLEKWLCRHIRLVRTEHIYLNNYKWIHDSWLQENWAQ